MKLTEIFGMMIKLVLFRPCMNVFLIIIIVPFFTVGNTAVILGAVIGGGAILFIVLVVLLLRKRSETISFPYTVALSLLFGSLMTPSSVSCMIQDV